MKIGIMGGTFDPIHNAHLILGEAAYRELGLDLVQFIPSGRPPHKRERHGATDGQRMRMAELAVADNPHFALSDREMNRSGYSYTYMTLEEMRREKPEDELYFLMGEDSLNDFPTWREPARICDAAVIVVARRHLQHGTGTLTDRVRRIRELYGADVRILRYPYLDIASSTLRDMALAGDSLRYYVPDPVWRYIEEEHLYRLPIEAGDAVAGAH